IEGGAAMLGQPITMALPRVVGCRLVGKLRPGVTATDLVLTLTERLRKYKVVAAFVEYFGPGLASLPFSDRATVSNMAPEYGATMGFFPLDALTLQYLAQTDRGQSNELIEYYARMQGLWHDPNGPQPEYEEVIEVDLSEILPSIAGPKRPQDRILLSESAAGFAKDVLQGAPVLPAAGVPVKGEAWTLDHGHVVIAAITSCTNTSNPSTMIAAGMLARNAVRLGLGTQPWVKTSLAPGSRVVVDYLSATGLQESLDKLGFQLVGFGCTTCMGNSGPLPANLSEAIENSEVITTAVLSGNRNFEGRIHPLARANYLCSPPLVVAYALAGTMRIDFQKDPIGISTEGKPVFRADIWPDPEELAALVTTALDPQRFRERYKDAFEGEARWQALPVDQSDTFQWDPSSLYMKEPPFFNTLAHELPERPSLEGARPLLILGDSITTDHISPVGTITPTSAAGLYLRGLGIEREDFNSFAARRVNHDVMLRGAFANIRIKNEMADGREGGWTRHMPDGELMPVHEAAERYRKEHVPLIVIAGKDYGAGSSRDWAAKGTQLLGVRAILAEGFERIHRSNLIGMGVLPLQFTANDNRLSLGLDGSERFDILRWKNIGPRSQVECVITRADGSQDTIELLCRLDTPLEAAYYENGGILHYIGRRLMTDAAQALPQ
ncbi:aconitate hydratase AcnA, partial [Bordetella sp. 02P26C-1]|uniref:aconitate hydratase AcnA n=1 Tax=Bordetella sp. 02P26C-1 TaxID=2683195 RepID=UPI001353AF6E